MSVAKAINGSQLLIKLGNGLVPETFSQPCLINTSRGIVFAGAPVESLLPDCADPDAVSWLDREIDGLNATISGAGILDTASLTIMWEWFRSGLSKNIQVTVNTSLLDGGGYWAGAAILSTFTVTGPARKEKATFECSILSDGIMTWVAA